MPVALKGGATNLKVGGGSMHWKEGGTKKLKFKKGGRGGFHDPQLLWWHRPGLHLITVSSML